METAAWAACPEFRRVPPSEAASLMDAGTRMNSIRLDADAHARLSASRNVLVGDEFRKEISEEPEKGQPGNAIGSQNPRATAFMLPHC